MKKEENKPNNAVLPIVLGIICAVLLAHGDQNNPMWILGFILGVLLGIIINKNLLLWISNKPSLASPASVA